MERRVVALCVMFSMVLCAAVVYAQDAAAVTPEVQATVEDPGMPEATPPTEEAPAAPELPTTPETQWTYGEVVAVNGAARTLSIKYPDYETDQEKEMTLAVNDATTFENAAALAELKAGDTVSIDYVLDAEAKAVATHISVEKPEAIPEGEPSSTPTNPEQTTPEQSTTEPAAPQTTPSSY